MNKLEILEEEIRKTLPKLKEVKEGCYLKDKSTDEIVKVFCVIPNNIQCIRISDNELISYQKKNLEYNPFEVIGHDILLSDILEWLKIKQFFIDDIYVDFDGYFGLLDMAYEKFKCFKVKWNLSKLYLKDQSKELIEFLFNLIQN